MKGDSKVSNKPNPGTDDFWLVQLFVLFRAVKTPLTENAIIVDLRRRKIAGVTEMLVRKALRSFVKKRYVQEIAGKESTFAATTLGKRVATKAKARLSVFVQLRLKGTL